MKIVRPSKVFPLFALLLLLITVVETVCGVLPPVCILAVMLLLFLSWAVPGKLFDNLPVLLLLLASSSAGRAQTGEDVAVLYAHDGDALYTINPNGGELTKVGDLKVPFPGGGFLPGSMTYDPRTKKLYAFAGYGPDGPITDQIFIEIDPHTAAVGKIAEYPHSGQALNLGYDWATGQLCVTITSTLLWSPISAIDPETGNMSVINRGSFIGGFGGQTTFFDNQGFFWLFAIDDFDRYLIKYDISVSDGKQLYFLGGRVQESGNEPRASNWPRYQSFSFDPYTGVLFATFSKSVTEGKEGIYYTGGDFHTSLCTVDLATGQPHKIIATYDKLNWSFFISWGLSR